jgi:signal transduction histidine kinase
MKDYFPFENASWPALLVEESGLIRVANHSAAELFGSVVQGGSAPLAGIWADETITPIKYLNNPARTGTGKATLKLKTKSGQTETLETFLCPLTREGVKYFALQVLPATTQAKSADASGLDANLAHKQKLDCALQLARTVALDFNNALTSVLGHASLLLSKADADHPWRTSLVEIEKSAAKAAEIAADLAAFSRQEKETKTQASGNLNTLIQRTVELFQRPENGNVTVSFHLAQKIFGVKFDEAKMQQAFVKVLENAFEASGERGQITIETRNMEIAAATQDRTVKLAPGTYVCVEFSDHGTGIDPEILPRVFEPFFTTKQKPHRGLGLAFAYGIITNHGGGIAVSSELNYGTSVRIYLPATKRVVKERTYEDNELFGVETILMVDDEDLLLNMGQAILSSFGYRVLTASTGAEALNILTSGEHIDLIITDLVMPQMSGRELIDHVRKTAPEMRILCTSGYVRSQGAEEESAYLQKPFTSQDLLRKVKEVLA